MTVRFLLSQYEQEGKKNNAEQNIAVISADLQYASRTLATKIIYLGTK